MSTNCIGYDGKAKTSPKIYIGVNGIARECAVGYVGVNGVARQIFPVINIPTVSGADTYEYDGTKKTVTLTNVDSEYVNVSGITQATNVGNYTITVSLKNNYATWEDGTKNPKTYQWGISAKKLSVPIINGDFYYNGEFRNAVVNSYDTNLITQSGSTRESQVGTYPITFKLINTTNYCWSDGTTADKVVNWQIKKTSVSVSQSVSNTCWWQKSSSSSSTSRPHYATIRFTAYNAAGEQIKLRYDVHCSSVSTWTVNSVENGFNIIRDSGQPNGSQVFTAGVDSDKNHNGTSSSITIVYDGTHVG